jgi:hypothetical protein
MKIVQLPIWFYDMIWHILTTLSLPVPPAIRPTHWLEKWQRHEGASAHPWPRNSSSHSQPPTSPNPSKTQRWTKRSGWRVHRKTWHFSSLNPSSSYLGPRFMVFRSTPICSTTRDRKVVVCMYVSWRLFRLYKRGTVSAISFPWLWSWFWWFFHIHIHTYWEGGERPLSPFTHSHFYYLYQLFTFPL